MRDAIDADVIPNPLGYYELKPEYRKDMDLFYEEEYYQNHYSLYREEYSLDELEYKNNLCCQKEYTIKSIFGGLERQASFLDIGCGEGYTLAWFSSKGWDVVGIDESVYGIRTHNPDMERFVIKGSFYKEIKRLKRRHYDFINADNVLEHVPDPLEFLNLLASLCDRGTLVCITVPNVFSQMQKLAYETGQIDSAFWVTKETSEHFSYFGADSLAELGNKAGLQKVAVLSDFPIDLFLLHTETNYRKKDVGHECHAAGIRIENRLFRNSLENAAKLHEALALNGIGRDISLYFKLAAG